MPASWPAGSWLREEAPLPRERVVQAIEQGVEAQPEAAEFVLRVRDGKAPAPTRRGGGGPPRLVDAGRLERSGASAASAAATSPR